MSAFIIISGSVTQDQASFEFEDSADGSETIADTIDVEHIGIILRDTVLLNSGDIDACIHRLANALRERAYT